jgi:hypothetical protein
MTDFLSRLVDRALGHAPVARPLIAPHFAQGAEIFGPDATPFAVTQTESYRYGDERALDTVSSAAPQGTASRFADENQASTLKREEAELKRQPEKARGTPAPHSDIDESLTLSPLLDRAAENSTPSITGREEAPRSSTRASSPPVVSPDIEQKTRQSPRIKASQSEKKVQRETSQLIKKPGEVRPADEMRKDMHQSESEQTPVSSTKNLTALENRSTEQQKSPTPHTGSGARRIERPSSMARSDVRVAKQWASNEYDDKQDVKSAADQKSPARDSASVPVEGVTPVPALPVEHGSGTERIVRPERVTARGRADSPLRATTNTRPSMQTPPTIKVTIGRIEVRAVLPPAPREQETALPRPAMSLDDYLKSMSGERR